MKNLKRGRLRTLRLGLSGVSILSMTRVGFSRVFPSFLYRTSALLKGTDGAWFSITQCTSSVDLLRVMSHLRCLEHFVG